MTKRISGPFEDEERQVEWQKEVLREEKRMPIISHKHREGMAVET